MKTMTTKPEIVTNDHLTFLDELSESGKTNMFGARPFLRAEFPELSKDEAGQVLSYWLAGFEEREAK